MSRALAIAFSLLLVLSLVGPASALDAAPPITDGLASLISRLVNGDGDDDEDDDDDDEDDDDDDEGDDDDDDDDDDEGEDDDDEDEDEDDEGNGNAGNQNGCNGVGNPNCTGNIMSGRQDPVVHDDTDGLSEGEQWTRESPDTSLEDVGATVGLGPITASFAAADSVGVAVIDTGVAEVPGLEHVIHGPDLSFDSQLENLSWVDGYGHGTHMAGIIGGRGVPGSDGLDLVGLAPDADLYSVKVGSHSGAVDVTQVIAAIDWVSQHADELGIRVLNISFGTDSVQPWHVDPLAYAVENAWRRGVVVVVAGGNDGESRDALRNPAISPWIVAVGASDSGGTAVITDDVLAPFSNRGTEDRRVDVLAPGVGVVSYRVAGSVLDEAYPAARRGEAGFSGSGSSQSAAVVSGLVARLLQAHPGATPDQVKAALIAGAQAIAGGDPATGAGVVNLAAAQEALGAAASLTLQDPLEGGATGTLDASRGTMRLEDSAGHFTRNRTNVVLEGEIDIHGQPFDVTTWAAASAAGQAWVDGTWNGVEWTGSGFEGDVWQGRAWHGRSWSGRAWHGRAWHGRSWSGRAWHGDSWDADGALFLSAGWLSLNPW